MKNSVKELTKYPLTLIFAIFVFMFFVLYFVFPEREISEWENRYMQMKPDVTLDGLKDGSFMGKYEDYVNDQMPYRDAFIKVKAVCETCIFKLENNGIARGKESHLFTKDIKGTDVIDKNISIIDEFSDTVSNDVTVTIAPNACGVLVSQVPYGFPVPSQGEKLEGILNDNSLLKSANVVDLYSVMNAHGDEYIYYRTDHHWTSYGAYLAYKQIMSGEDTVVLSELKGHEIPDFLGTLYAKYKGINVEPDVLTYYEIPVTYYKVQTGNDMSSFESLYDTDAASKFDKYGLFLRGNFGYSEIESASIKNGKTAVIFKDSYANSLIPFMTYNYEKLIVIDLRFFNKSVSELVNDNPDADIFFIYNFDFLNEDTHFYRLLQDM